MTCFLALLRYHMQSNTRELSPGAPCPPLSLLRRISKIIRDALDEGDDVDEAGNGCVEEDLELRFSHLA